MFVVYLASYFLQAVGHPSLEFRREVWDEDRNLGDIFAYVQVETKPVGDITQSGKSNETENQSLRVKF